MDGDVFFGRTTGGELVVCSVATNQSVLSVHVISPTRRSVNSEHQGGVEESSHETLSSPKFLHLITV